MALTNSEAIIFDLVEIETELQITDKKFSPLTPLVTGSCVPDFVLMKENLNKSLFSDSHKIHRSELLKQLRGKPLVISFYSPEWQEYGLVQLKHLNVLSKEIKDNGGNLLIICSGEASLLLEELIWDNSLQLDFYFDNDNTIAKQFGLYSDDSPAWDKYPGIEVNVPLLATYVIDQFYSIIFDSIDYKLQGLENGEELLNAVQLGYFYQADRRSA